MTLFFESFLRRYHYIFLLVFLGILIVACEGAELDEEPTPTEEILLTSYLTSTPRTELNLQVNKKNPPDAPVELPSPTPTPHIYEVIENDTLIGIANRHSVLLDELIAANPGIDPNFLTIGLTLTIPIADVSTDISPITTPIPLSIHPPKCYRLSEHLFQCMSVVENDTAFDVENVSAKISIQISDGNLVSNTAFMPLDLLPTGDRAAVLATFPYPLPQDVVGDVELITVIPVNRTYQRFLKTDLHIEEMEYSQDGSIATITGMVSFSTEQSEAGVIGVSAFAYDAQDEIVGFRKWVADEDIDPAKEIKFTISVYSLEGPIETVDVLVEARPKKE